MITQLPRIMNTDTVLPNIGMIDDHQYMQFFSNDQNHYMVGIITRQLYLFN